MSYILSEGPGQTTRKWTALAASSFPSPAAAETTETATPRRDAAVTVTTALAAIPPLAYRQPPPAGLAAPKGGFFLGWGRGP